MSLTQALNSAADGLRVTQAALSLVASNVANAQTPGYTRKTLDQQASAFGDSGISVVAVGINRELDTYLQTQLRTETSGSSYADIKSQFYQQLQQVYGTPGGSATLDSAFNSFTSALQTLTNSPGDYSARTGALNAASVLTQQLNTMTTGIQGLRSNAEQGISDDVTSANDNLQTIAQVNQQLMNSSSNDATTASLLDQRDNAIDELSQYMNIKVVPGDRNQVNVFTSTGIQLVGATASTLSFNGGGQLTPNAAWSPDPTQDGVGTIKLSGPNGGSIDLLAGKSILSGQLAAYVEMRDTILPQAQSQLDEFAAAISRSLSDQTTSGTPATSGPATGFALDTTGMQPGNTIKFTYTDSTTGKQATYSIVNVTDPAALPLKDTSSTDPNAKVVGVNWSGGLPSVVTQLNNMFGNKLQFSTSGSTLNILDDGANNTTDVASASITKTITGLSSGTSQLPLFTDATTPYTGAVAASAEQVTGYAGRITVNQALLADPSSLVSYQPGTPSGDATRPNFIYTTLTQSAIPMSPRTGIGSASAPYDSTLTGYLQQLTSQQGDAASAAQNLSQGQTLVVNALKQRVNNESAVNVDQEMSNLLTLQNAYGANARVLSALKDMMQTLMQI